MNITDTSAMERFYLLSLWTLTQSNMQQIIVQVFTSCLVEFEQLQYSLVNHPVNVF
jgi:hypothetical protein